MDYVKIYDSLVQRAKSRELSGYVEKHHVVPKCLGGSNSKANLVKLTAREHFVAHLLLTKIYPKEHKLSCAAYFMYCVKGMKITSRSIEALRLSAIEARRTPEVRAKMSKSQTGKETSPETREKQRQNILDRPKELQNRFIQSFGEGSKHTEETKSLMRKSWKSRSPMTEETKAKMSEAVKSRPPISELTRNKMSVSQSGKKMSELSKQKNSAAKLGIPRTDELKKKVSEGVKRTLRLKRERKEILTLWASI